VDAARLIGRARQPDVAGVIERDGVRVAYESAGAGDATILFLPSWTLVPQRQWRAQVPYLARHCRVVTFDPRGNGGSDHPEAVAAYADREIAADAVGVLDALGVEHAALVSWSSGAGPALIVAADHPERVMRAVFFAPTLPFAPLPERGSDFESPDLDDEGWHRFNRHSWQRDFPGFAEWFARQIYTEPFSTRLVEQTVEWARGTTPAALARAVDVEPTGEAEARALARRVSCPVLVIQGDEDRITPPAASAELAKASDGRLVTFEGSGHGPLARDPVRTNLVLRDFLLQSPPPQRFRRALARPRRALFLSSPIGLGHARRDIAIARELRSLRPGLEIDWLASHPVTAMLEAHGERIHPASAALANEADHIEAAVSSHTLPVFEAVYRMDEILLANFGVFLDLVREEPYDAWVGDELLHENPELKTASYVWLTDFVGSLPLPEGGEREALLTAEANAKMVRNVERYPSVRDLALFVGSPADIPPGRFGPELPEIRPWVEGRYVFTGQIVERAPLPSDERRRVRARLGWRDDEIVCVASAGGTAAGAALLQLAIDALPAIRARLPGLRLVVVSGPRLAPAAFRAEPGIDVVGYVDDLDLVLGACDVAVAQGGLSTTLELAAARVPFVYVPLRHHHEQQINVAYRLERLGAGRRLDFAAATHEVLAAAIAEAVARPPAWARLEPGGAARAAQLIAALL
jgi:pimeloyl-ACP methyl ester carboxylesterase/predicted glycosyltransferase